MPTRRPPRHRPALLPVLVLLSVIGAAGGCSAGGGAYPSLARLPAERQSDSAPATTIVPGATGDSVVSPELAGRLGKLLDQARGAKRDFDDLLPAAERAVKAAGSAPAGSEEWARATQALSGIQAARAQTAQPLADLDRLDVDNQVEGARLSPDRNAARPDTAAISRTRDMIGELVAQEDTVLAGLDGRQTP